MTRIFPGDPLPLGCSFDGIGANISVFSEIAEAVEICLFDDAGAETRLELPERTGQTVHGYLPDISPGPALRVPCPRAVESGRRPALQSEQVAARPVCPRRRRARAVERSRVRVSASDNPDERNDADSAPFVPRSVVVNPWFDWEGDQLLRTPWSDTIIYEAHVKGATKLHPDIETELRGTYAGIAHPAFVEHLTSLGITAIELLPVHQFVHDAHLVERGLRNYWGYNSIGFFAPHNEYDHRGQRGEQVQDFKQMVKVLHGAGIEVILDVVYNHTAEGNHLGPVLSFKGIDNAAYYRLVDDDRRHYMDYTGTGNSLNMRNPYVLQLVMDSLRYWVTEMHVDGFRFDLASTLARGLHEVDRLSAFFDLIQQDPTISQVKLIAEPWDVGEGGYQVGNFPPQWAEWNGKYRDCLRDYWRGSDQTPRRVRLPHHGLVGPVRGRRSPASREHQLHHRPRRLHVARSRLVQRQAQRGQRRGQPRRNRRQPLVELRRRGFDRRPRGQRPTSSTAAQLHHVPARCRRESPCCSAATSSAVRREGNNNAYCQDNEISWYDWAHADENLLSFTRGIIEFRHNHRVFRRRTFFQGRPIHGTGVSDIAWFTPAGDEMEEHDWAEGLAKTLGVFLNGDALETGRRGEEYTDDSFLLLFNAHHEPVVFTVPPSRWGDDVGARDGHNRRGRSRPSTRS